MVERKAINYPGHAAGLDLFRQARQRPIAGRQVIQNPDLAAHQ